jgi:hypothetical protein
VPDGSGACAHFTQLWNSGLHTLSLSTWESSLPVVPYLASSTCQQNGSHAAVRVAPCPVHLVHLRDLQQGQRQPPQQQKHGIRAVRNRR